MMSIKSISDVWDHKNLIRFFIKLEYKKTPLILNNGVDNVLELCKS